MTGKKPMKIGLYDVIRALKVIDDHGAIRHMFLLLRKQVRIASRKHNAGARPGAPLPLRLRRP